MGNLSSLVQGVKRLKEREAEQPALMPTGSTADSTAVLTRLVGHTKTQVECTLEAVAEEREELAKYHATVTQMLSDRSRLEQDLQERNHEVSRLTSELAKWEKAAVAYFDTLQRTLAFPDLTESERSYTERDVRDFARAVLQTGLEPIRPTAGDPFVEAHLQATGYETSEIPAGSVVRCLSWGYRNGSRVIRRAEVTISGKEAK